MDWSLDSHHGDQTAAERELDVARHYLEGMVKVVVVSSY
jgi:hypothetical protein